MEKADKYFIINEQIDEFHSFESFFKVSFLDKQSLYINFVDIGINNHPINNSSTMKFINKCILKANKIVYLKINKDILIESNDDNFESYFFGGYNLSKNEHNEIEIKAKTIEILLPLDYKMSERKWLCIHKLKNIDAKLSNFLNSPAPASL